MKRVQARTQTLPNGCTLAIVGDGRHSWVTYSFYYTELELRLEALEELAKLYEGLTEKANHRIRQKCRRDFGPSSGLFIVPKDGAAPLVAELERLLSDPGNLTQSKGVFREMGLTYDGLIKETKKSKNEG